MIKFYDSMGGSQGIAALTELVDACDFWQDNMDVSIGDIVRSSTNSLIYAECTEEGTTGTTEPTWGATEGAEISDGTTKWLIHDLRNAKNAESAEKLKNAPKINGIEFDGTQDIELPIASSSSTTSSSSSSDSMDKSTYIGEGLKVSEFTKHVVSISSGKAKINGKIVESDGGNLTIDQRETALMHLGSDGKLGKITAKYPTNWIDDNTVGFWIFNKGVGENVPNIAVGKSSIAVENDFVQHGLQEDIEGNICSGVASVDGWADYALQTDGSTGYLELANNTGFMKGDVEWEIDMLVTVDQFSSSMAYLFNYAGDVATIRISYDGRLYASDTSGYNVEMGRTFLFSYVYKNGISRGYVDGKQVLERTITFNLTLNSTQNTRIGCSYNGDSMLRTTFHYMEIRNKARTQAEIAQIANQLLLPCFYYKDNSSYPELKNKVSDYCEWKFDDDTAKTLTDTNGNNSGVSGGSTNPTQIDSSLGLGKASYFPGSTNCCYDLGTMTIPEEFTFVAVVNPDDPSSYYRIFGNKVNSSPGFIISCHATVNSTGYGLSLYTGASNGATWITSTLHLASNFENFIAVRVTSEYVYFRVNESVQRMRNAYWKTGISTNAAIGTVNTYNYPFKGSISYMLFAPKALSDATIDYMYYKIMARGRKNILNDVVPSSSAAIGFIRADNDSIIEYNDTDYKYGRREGATGGNRRVFLGYKYFSGSSTLSWENPFGTQRVRKYLTWALHPDGTNEVEVEREYYNSGSIGVSYCSENNSASEDTKLYCRTYSSSGGGAASYNGYSKKSGYIGCYAEVMEDYKGIDGK